MNDKSVRALLASRYRPAISVGTNESIPEPDVAPCHFSCGNLMLWGRSLANGDTPSQEMDDALAQPYPFDPVRVVNDLRLERYATQDGTGGKPIPSTLVRAAYYLLRPLMPVAFRKHLQRRALAGWDSIPFPNWPVDSTVDRLYTLLLADAMKARGIDELPFIWYWPDGKKTAIAMTHDVETAFGRDQSTSLAKLDTSFGIRSSFQFIPERRYETPAELRTEILANGCEVNVHGLNHDGKLFDTEQCFRERALKINRYARSWGAKGFRSPVLHRNPEWFDALEFEYDMSIPNVGHLDPQRGGCCTTVPFFVGSILELPLTTIQDYSLFHILGEYSIETWCKQIESIVSESGLVCFNTHPDYLNGVRERKVYEDLLGYIRDTARAENLWISTPGDIATWWQQRSAMTLKSTDHGWRIVGEGNERARIAYARLTKGELKYYLVAGG